MPALALLKGATDAADVPGVSIRREMAFGRLLRAEEPHVVRQLALRVRPRVRIRRLPRAGNADRVGVERERLLVLREVQNMRVAAGELRLGLLAEGVVPDDPIPQVEPDLPAGDH